MRATVDAKAFSNALDKVSKVLQKSACVPVLEEALICFSNGRCTLTGTSLDAWLTTVIPAQGDDFSFVFYRTANVAKACRRFDGELKLELTETGEGRDRRRELVMSCGSRTGEFHTLFPEDYPEMSRLAPEYSHTVTANAASLLKRVNRVSKPMGMKYCSFFTDIKESVGKNIDIITRDGLYNPATLEANSSLIKKITEERKCIYE